MNKWEKPKVFTIAEKDLKKLIITGACSLFCYAGWGQPEKN